MACRLDIVAHMCYYSTIKKGNLMKKIITLALLLTIVSPTIANAKVCGTTHTSKHSVYTHKNTYRWHTSCSK